MNYIFLCGGSGTRLWPVSRKSYPKQFCKLVGDRSLFLETLLRNDVASEKKLIVTSAESYFMASEQIKEISSSGNPEDITYILEPVGRNTAPAIAFACLAAGGGSIVFVSPTDHLIKNTAQYREILKTAEVEAQKGFLVTFGIIPQYAETGYGYIETENPDLYSGAQNVISFREKPTLEKAEEFIRTGRFLWNSGMFCFRADVFLSELKKYAPEIYEKTKSAYENTKEEEGVLRISHEDMMSIPAESIDYAVMEKSSIVKVIPSSFGWNDIGSFDSLEKEFEKDESGNTVSDRFINIAAENNFIISDRVVSVVGADDLIIVDTPDALLVAKKGDSQKVKQVVDAINEKGDHISHITKSHTTDYRPWGYYTVLEEHSRFKIKRIVVKPGKRLSLQKHFHRSEHWVIVSGSAIVTKGGEELFLKANESVYIPIGETHRIENPGRIDLVFLEVQVGEYLSEDDIVRLADDYRRTDRND